jgi:LacI family transcriptional regulator, repressor for deo operon, udp, cdd, tsx, nupC, and nupG
VPVVRAGAVRETAGRWVIEPTPRTRRGGAGTHRPAPLVVPAPGEPGTPRPTIEDVAALAAVSVATVSRALRGLPHVAPATRERVLEAARELDYVADPAAARLATGRNVAVGLVVPMIAHWYYARVFAGIEGVLAAAGYDVLLYQTAGPSGIDRSLDELPFRKRVDGLVVVDATLDDAALDRIVAAGVRLVTIGVRAPRSPSVTVENRRAARQAVAHLTELGHRRIALIAGMDEDPFGFSTPLERRRGYEDALEAAGVEPDPALVVPGHFTYDGGAAAMQRLLTLSDPPTAVFAMSDEMAIGAAKVLREAGIDVPGQVSVVGFDDHEVAAYIGLTTVRQDVLWTGERAAALLLERLREPSASRSERRGAAPSAHESVPTHLVLRSTTAPPPVRARDGRDR